MYDGLNVENREKFLDLYRPIENPGLLQLSNQLQGSREWSSRLPLLIKVCSIYSLNACGFGNNNETGLFEQYSRLTHSCYSNCTRETAADDQLICRAVRNIKAGEALTISYMNERAFEPTHTRRYRYLMSKGFTCHCPRCDTLGDDTRQFNCFNATCPGSHLVREPISLTPALPPGYAYTGVEYVEPHLLPCTICQRSPPPAYQIAMFQLEERLSSTLTSLKNRTAAATGAQILPLLEELFALSLPRTHAVLQLSAGEVRCKLAVRLDDVPDKWGAHREVYRCCARANLQCARVTEALLPDTAHVRVSARWDYAAGGLLRWFQPGDDLLLQKEVLLKTLRVRLILYGRDVREEAFDDPVREIHLKLMHQTVFNVPVVSTEVCAFCEESPLRAAMKRSRCGACKKVMYCRVGCQKAHWKVHKAQCGKEAAVGVEKEVA